jgi:TetR/AcrR family transcriptional regulator, transcriptional repressor for nem operon
MMIEIHTHTSSIHSGCQITSRWRLASCLVIYSRGMGYSKASKANTHARLVAAAAARFKERGIDGISLSDLMKDLQLTHGGFYKHFDSRDELVAEALDLALAQSSQAMREHLFDGDKPDIPGFVDFYLNEAHRDGRAGGCAVAALAGDAPRKSAAVQAQFREHIDGNLRSLIEVLKPASLQESRDSRESAILILCSLYGALMTARAVGDSSLSREILRTVRKRLLTLTPPVKRGRVRARARTKNKNSETAH